MYHSFIHPVIGLVPDLKELLVQQGTVTMATKHMSPGLEFSVTEAAQSKAAWDMTEGVGAS